MTGFTTGEMSNSADRASCYMLHDAIYGGPGMAEDGPTGQDAPGQRAPRHGVTRRTMLKGAAAAGLASQLGLWLSRAEASTGDDWTAFDQAISGAFERMGMVGSALAVVRADEVLYQRTLGVRDLASGAPVTPDTHFLVASTTKSMTSALVATYVDSGALAWEQPVVDAWPKFRAPTDELTRSLRVIDLFCMATGIGEPASISAFAQGDPTTGQILDLLAILPVDHAPNEQFFYNNTVYTVGGYLPLLAQGVEVEDLAAAYAEAMRERVFRPAGMARTLIAADPRGVVEDYATGNGPAFGQGIVAQPYGPLGSFTPVGGALSNLEDMSAYVQMQLRRGVSVDGTRVASAANLEETWKGHVAIDLPPDVDPDATSASYARGWIAVDYRGGHELIWHNGGIDGFSTFIGFLPDDDLGLVVLNDMGPEPLGLYYYQYVLNTLLESRLGLNAGMPSKVEAAYEAVVASLDELAAEAVPVDPDVVAPYLGHYQGGFTVALDPAGALHVRKGGRVIPLLALGDDYVASGGLIPGLSVRFSLDADEVPRMELVGVDSVRRTTGLDDAR
ncbi:MAG: serine hydrolase [Acidimicrobiia bacterium]|nr:serine hydrolase [Acidimicrobiia bacterium]